MPMLLVFTFLIGWRNDVEDLIELILETVVFFFQFADAILQLFFRGHAASSFDKAPKPLEQLQKFWNIFGTKSII
jgi:hypothetical protein